jgi:hypothetical protein
MSAVVDDIGRLLAAEVTGWDYATNRALDPAKTPVCVAGSPEEPDAAVVVNTYPGGPEPDSREGDEYPRLQVRVRATDPLVALVLDQSAYDVLQAAPAKYPAPLPSGRLMQDCYAMQSAAQPLGRDANGRWEYVRNYQLHIVSS